MSRLCLESIKVSASTDYDMAFYLRHDLAKTIIVVLHRSIPARSERVS
jgi:hypothetical protein